MMISGKSNRNKMLLIFRHKAIPKSPIHSITSQSSISPSIEGISKQSDHSDHSIEKKNAEKLCLKEGDKQNTPSHQKILYRQKVEQGLRQELSSFCNKDSDGRMFDIQVSEFSLEAILTGSSKITAQTIVDLFNVAMK